FIVDSGALVSISHVAFKGCMLYIFDGNLTLTDSIVSGANNAFGILNADTFSLINSTVSGNLADGSGGGIGNAGTASLINSTVSGNSAPKSGGGGIMNGKILSMINSTVSGNSAAYGGGMRMPFHTGFTVTAVMRFCTIYDNLATQGASGIWI